MNYKKIAELAGKIDKFQHDLLIFKTHGINTVDFYFSGVNRPKIVLDKDTINMDVKHLIKISIANNIKDLKQELKLLVGENNNR